MIRGITQPVTPEALALPAGQRRTAAGLYIGSVDRLFAKFDLLTAGGDCLFAFTPYDGEMVRAISERDTRDMVVFAPDSQMHLYTLTGADEIWRKDYPLPGSEAAISGETARLCVNQDEVGALFDVLMRGEISVVL